MLLEKLSLSPLQVFWWQRTVEFFNKLAASPLGSLFHLTLLDNLRDAFHHGVDDVCISICWSLTSIGHLMSRDCSVASVHDVPVIIELLRQHLQGTHAYEVHGPRTASSVGVVSCTYHHWFNPYSKTRHHCQLPVSGRRMQRFLQFRLAAHGLPIVTGRFPGGQHVDRARRVCVHCGGLSAGDELHMVYECPALQPLRQRYAPLFSTQTDTMRALSLSLSY